MFKEDIFYMVVGSFLAIAVIGCFLDIDAPGTAAYIRHVEDRKVVDIPAYEVERPSQTLGFDL